MNTYFAWRFVASRTVGHRHRLRVIVFAFFSMRTLKDSLHRRNYMLVSSVENALGVCDVIFDLVGVV